jgi:hypothetical protein
MGERIISYRTMDPEQARPKFKAAGILLDVTFGAAGEYRLQKWGAWDQEIDPKTLSPDLKKVWDALNAPKPSKAVMDANAKRWRDLYRLVERAWKERKVTA